VSYNVDGYFGYIGQLGSCGCASCRPLNPPKRRAFPTHISKHEQRSSRHVALDFSENNTYKAKYQGPGSSQGTSSIESLSTPAPSTTMNPGESYADFAARRKALNARAVRTELIITSGAYSQPLMLYRTHQKHRQRLTFTSM
jgi:hypothetical protein